VLSEPSGSGRRRHQCVPSSYAITAVMRKTVPELDDSTSSTPQPRGPPAAFYRHRRPTATWPASVVTVTSCKGSAPAVLDPGPRWPAAGRTQSLQAAATTLTTHWKTVNDSGRPRHARRSLDSFCLDSTLELYQSRCPTTADYRPLAVFGKVVVKCKTSKIGLCGYPDTHCNDKRWRLIHNIQNPTCQSRDSGIFLDQFIWVQHIWKSRRGPGNKYTCWWQFYMQWTVEIADAP